MATTTEMNGSKGHGKELRQGRKEWLLPVWRESIVSTGEADLTDVSFYPYGIEGEDPVFAAVGIGMVLIFQYQRSTSSQTGNIRLLHEYKDKERKSRGFWKEEKLHNDVIDQENIGNEDKHHQARSIAWARRDDGLPLLCVTGSGAIPPIPDAKREDQTRREKDADFTPTAKINTFIKVIDPFTGKRIQTLMGHGKAITALATTSTHPHILASASDDKNIYLWSLATAHTKAPCVAVLGGWGHIDRILCLAWHSSGDWLLSGGFDNRVCLWRAIEYPDPQAPCGSWTAEVVDAPYFVTSEVHRHPVVRVAFLDDTIISYAATEPCITQWRMQGFSSKTLAELLPPKPTFVDEDARTRSAWAYADRKDPLYRLLVQFDMPAETDETREDVWHLKRPNVNFDTCVPQQRNGRGKTKAATLQHATLAVCRGREVRFCDFKRLLTWHTESKKSKEGQQLRLPWGIEDKAVSKEDEMDLDEKEAEESLRIFAVQKKASKASASTPVESSLVKSNRPKKKYARKTGAPSTGGVPSEPADSPLNLRTRLFDAKMARTVNFARKSVRSNSTVSHTSGFRNIGDAIDAEGRAAVSPLAQEARTRQPKKASYLADDIHQGKENDRNDIEDEDGDVVMGLDGAGDERPRQVRPFKMLPSKMLSRKTAPSTGGVSSYPDLFLSESGDQRLRPKLYEKMPPDSIQRSIPAGKSAIVTTSADPIPKDDDHKNGGTPNTLAEPPAKIPPENENEVVGVTKAQRQHHKDREDMHSRENGDGGGTADSAASKSRAAPNPQGRSQVARRSDNQPDSDGEATTIPSSNAPRGRKPPLLDDPKRIHICPLCKRNFRRKAHLKRHHVTKHEQIKDFECEKCGKKFARKDNLAQHGRACKGAEVVDGDELNEAGKGDDGKEGEDEGNSEPVRSPVGRRRRHGGFGMHGAGSQDEADSEPIRSPVGRRHKPMGFGMDGAGSDDDGSRARTKDDQSAKGSASMEESTRSRQSPQKLPEDDEMSGEEDVGVTNSVLTEGDGKNVDAELERPKRFNFKNTASFNIAPNAIGRKKSVADGFTAALSGTGEARMKRLASIAAATRGEEAPQLAGAAIVDSASRSGGLFASTSSPQRPAIPRSLPHSAADFDDPMDEDTISHAPLPILTKPPLVSSGLSTANASADSARRSSRRPGSRRNELEIDMRVKSRKTTCNSCSGPLKGLGKNNWSMEVPGENEGDPIREFCAFCWEGDYKGRDVPGASTSNREQEKGGKRRMELGKEGAEKRCCLCGSAEAKKWHYRLHKSEVFGEGKVCCKRCHDRDYRERMNPGSTGKRTAAAAARNAGRDVAPFNATERSRKRPRDLSPDTAVSPGTVVTLTSSEKAALPESLEKTQEGREMILDHIIDKGLRDLNLNFDPFVTSSPAKSSSSPQRPDGVGIKEEYQPKEKQGGWEKYHMGDPWRPLEAHAVAEGPSSEEVARCCRWSPDGRLLVVVGDFGVVSVYTRP